jgi:hypothetical protein
MNSGGTGKHTSDLPPHMSKKSENSWGRHMAAKLSTRYKKPQHTQRISNSSYIIDNFSD